jgi:hypothetical protein
MKCAKRKAVPIDEHKCSSTIASAPLLAAGVLHREVLSLAGDYTYARLAWGHEAGATTTNQNGAELVVTH